MNHKQIEIGGEYGVVARRTERAVPVKGTVLAKDGSYQVWKSGGFSGRYETMSNGIIVQFDEPMVQNYDNYETAVNPVYRDAVNVERRKAANTQVVVPARCIIEPWADIAERNAQRDEADRRRKEKIDACADETEPIIAAINMKLAEADVSPSFKPLSPSGTTRKRTVDATYTFEYEDLARLLGVEHESIERR